MFWEIIYLHFLKIRKMFGPRKLLAIIYDACVSNSVPNIQLSIASTCIITDITVKHLKSGHSEIRTCLKSGHFS